MVSVDNTRIEESSSLQDSPSSLCLGMKLMKRVERWSPFPLEQVKPLAVSKLKAVFFVLPMCNYRPVCFRTVYIQEK